MQIRVNGKNYALSNLKSVAIYEEDGNEDTTKPLNQLLKCLKAVNFEGREGLEFG